VWDGQFDSMWVFAHRLGKGVSGFKKLAVGSFRCDVGAFVGNTNGDDL